MSKVLNVNGCIFYNYFVGDEREQFFVMEKTGQVKTDLGECDLNVFRPSGKRHKIFLSNPAESEDESLFNQL